MAILAVSLAALSLVLLGKTGIPQMDIYHEMAASAELTKADHSGGSAVLYVVLLIFGLAKLALVVGIFRNTHRANHEDWNDRAVDYRYLAERLRAMYYLPQVGSFQPPAAAAPQYASRVVRQSSVDWLFDAIVRASPPSEVDGVKARTIATTEVKFLSPDAKQAVLNVRDHWIREQFVYHAGNAP